MLKIIFVISMVFVGAQGFADSAPADESSDGITHATSTKIPGDCPKCRASLAADSNFNDPSIMAQKAQMDTVVKTTGDDATTCPTCATKAKK